MNKLRYILQHRYYIKVLTIAILTITIIVTTIYQKQSLYTDETTFVGIVYRITHKDDKITIYIKAKEKLIINYYEELNNISIGDTVKVSGKLDKPSNNTIPNLFNYREYLYNENIFYVVKANKIIKLKNNTSIIYHIRNIIDKRINSIGKNDEYLKIFILGVKDNLSSKIMDSYRINGLNHLFSISGMHISLFVGVIFLILKRISYNNFYNYTVVIAFLLFYTTLIGYSPSLVRSLIMYILFAINKLFNLKISNINIMLLLLIIALIINPYYIYNQSFIFSYLISLSLVIYSPRIKKIKNKIIRLFYISLISFLVSMPICIYTYYQINILSVLLNIIYVPLISLIIFPLSLICFIIPALIPILTILTTIIEKISLTISNYKLGIITFPKPNIVVIIIYYILIFLFLYNKKYCYIFAFLLIHKALIYSNYSVVLTYLDVGQGDSIFIKFPYNKGNILIDTGGNTNNNNEIVKNKIIPYLNSIGINSIDYLIISHGDYDHMGEAINLVNNFKVEKVIFNCGTYNDLEKELIKVLDKKKIKYYSCIKELNIDNNKLHFLQTKEYDNENDNSNVIYTELNGYKFMFMGDAGIDKEKDILDKYNISNIDVLKVGHHGSKTSSSENFINEMNPKYSIISVGNNNRYGHPNKEVLNNLENSKIYRTDQDGSIMFKIKNNKLKINIFN